MQLTMITKMRMICLFILFLNQVFSLSGQTAEVVHPLGVLSVLLQVVTHYIGHPIPEQAGHAG